jgi:hypothetical protein
LYLYRSYNPSEVSFFPQCPFYRTTGYKCPGCGSQRAVHFLLNGHIDNAFAANPLLVISIPYLIGGFLLVDIKHKNQKWHRIRSKLYGLYATYIALAIVLVFAVVRNL